MDSVVSLVFEPYLPRDLASARAAALDPVRVARIGGAIAAHAFDSAFTGLILVVALDPSTAASLRDHAETRWRAIARAMSAGMAHMDPADLTDERAREIEARIAAMDASRLVLANAAVPACPTCFLFTDVANLPRDHARFTAAYVDAPCDVNAARVIDVGGWRATAAWPSS